MCTTFKREKHCPGNKYTRWRLRSPPRIYPPLRLPSTIFLTGDTTCYLHTARISHLIYVTYLRFKVCGSTNNVLPYSWRFNQPLRDDDLELTGLLVAQPLIMQYEANLAERQDIANLAQLNPDSTSAPDLSSDRFSQLLGKHTWYYSNR